MSLDGLVIRAVVRELQSCVDGRIHKIHQPSPSDVVLHIRARGSNRRLLISANPTYPRIHFTERNFPNPPEAPMFCMLLRKHFEGAVIETVEQIGLERIIRIRVRQRDELGDESQKALLAEIMGRHSNLILLEPASETILDGIHHVTPVISSYRVVMPGSRYTPPPAQHKANPLEADRAEFFRRMGDGTEPGNPQTDKPGRIRPLCAETAARRLVSSFSGISPLAAAEIAHRAGLPDACPTGRSEAESLEPLWDAFQSVMESLRSHEYCPNLVRNPETGKSFFSVIGLTHLQGEAETFDSVSSLLEAYYGDKAERDTVKQRVSDLLKFLQNEKSKNVNKLEKLEETLKDAHEADRYRIMGELLTASMHSFSKGDTEARVVNYYDEHQAPLTIPLDPLLTPSENAQRYFKKYTKMKNSISAVQGQIAHTKSEIAYFETLLQQLQTAGLADIEEIRDELIEQGYIRDRNKKARKQKKKQKPVLTGYISSEGVPIYVGKNNTQNEYLTNRLAHPGDTWLHTKDIPGSHVVIRGSRFGDDTLHEAAQLAAYFSQARNSSSVPVDYTLIRHVRKPNGSKPGFVIYDHQKTLYVTPNERLIASLPSAIKA